MVWNYLDLNEWFTTYSVTVYIIYFPQIFMRYMSCAVSCGRVYVCVCWYRSKENAS